MRAHDADFVLSDLGSLRERPQMVAPKSAVLSTHTAANFVNCFGVRGWPAVPMFALARSASTRALSRVAFNSSIRSFSEGSSRSATPFSMASQRRFRRCSASAARLVISFA